VADRRNVVGCTFIALPTISYQDADCAGQFNTPVQLGPASSTRPRDAQVFTVPVEADDILVLASDGLSDNLWDEDILDEVVRFRRSFMSSPSSSSSSSFASPSPASASLPPLSSLGASPASGAGLAGSLLRRTTLAGMLSEALCSRARCVSERRGQRVPSHRPSSPLPASPVDEEIPFARRAREQGRWFDGGKPDGTFVLLFVGCIQV
jgi:hypothetical protein